jgi:hypothetical protein
MNNQMALLQLLFWLLPMTILSLWFVVSIYVLGKVRKLEPR